MTDRPTLIELVREPPLAWIVLNHPEKLNAWSWESARQITAHAESAALRRRDPRRDRARRGARVLRRRRPRHARGPHHRPLARREDAQLLRALPLGARALPRCSPSCRSRCSMAIHGYCLGAGLEVAMMGDIRIAADDARFALPEPKVGVSIDAGGDLRLIAEIGAGWTQLLAFTGRRIDAETALRLGIVQEVVPRDALREHVRALGARDRRQRAARGAGDQAHDQLPRAAGPRRGAALRGRERRAAVHLRRHGAGLQGDGREADARVRGKVVDPQSPGASNRPLPSTSTNTGFVNAVGDEARRDHLGVEARMRADPLPRDRRRAARPPRA